MNKAVLFDDNTWYKLLPLTYTRPIAYIRIGILTIKEKWEHYFDISGHITQEYLSNKFKPAKEDVHLFINGSVIPTESLVKEIQKLNMNEALVFDDKVIACRAESFDPLKPLSNIEESIFYEDEFRNLNEVWDIYSMNGDELESDFEIITKGRTSQPISETNNVLAPENIFIEEGAEIEFATINAKNAKVYIGKDATIMEGSLIRGSLALCDHSTLKLGAKIYGPTTIGPHSKIGGEVNNSVVFGYSNKAHDGFLGNSVLGEWCNLGADTNTSNLKNNYTEVRVWSFAKDKFVGTGKQFCGLIMGDHSKCGINTMFNTGTVVGVSANIYGGGYPRNFVPSFVWGGAAGYMAYALSKALKTAEIVYSRRNLEFDEDEKAILTQIYNITENYRIL
ncbi:MAG: GlmU family protein [Bacteroidales bacterium]|nr:GlmU family protein [Bacteroidales bacterium]